MLRPRFRYYLAGAVALVGIVSVALELDWAWRRRRRFGFEVADHEPLLTHENSPVDQNGVYRTAANVNDAVVHSSDGIGKGVVPVELNQRGVRGQFLSWEYSLAVVYSSVGALACNWYIGTVLDQVSTHIYIFIYMCVHVGV